MSRVRVYRKWEDEEPDSEAVSPVWIGTFADESEKPTDSVKWEHWVPAP